MRKFTEEEIKFVKDCLSKHIPATRFLKSVLHVDGRTFKRMCKDVGIEYPQFRKNKIWENPFVNIKNPNVQYWLGWLATDGSVQTKGRELRCSLRLQERDRDVIEKFNNFLGGNLKISTVIHHQKFPQVGISFRNRNIISFLETLGYNNNKTFTFDPKFEISWDYIRGCFEGDGYLRWGNTCEFNIISASINHIKKLKMFFEKHGFDMKLKNVNKGKGTIIYYLSCYKRQQIKLILDNLYKDADTFMNRKYALARSISNSAWKPLKFGEPASGIPSEAQEIGNV